MLFALRVACLGQVFENVTEEAGVSYIQMDPEYVSPVEGGVDQFQSGGAAAGDYDNDGWVDLFVTRVGDGDILFRNLGPDENGVVHFMDVSVTAGITAVYDSNGVAWADFNRDGFLDLYVNTIYENRNYLYFNNGDGTFREAPQSRGANLQNSLIAKKGTSVAVGDYDMNGWIDIHTTEWFINTAAEGSEYHNVLLQNLGPNAPAYFKNETQRAGTVINRGDVQLVPYGFAFASSLVDLDNDGWPDLAVTGDFVSSQMFWNDGNGTFTEKTEEAGLGLANNAMGSTFADFDEDGDLDWYVTSRYDNRLYQNLGNREFVDIARDKGIDNTGWGWAASWLDYDNDGDWDLAVTNGYNDYSGNLPDIDPTYFYVNEDGHFRSAAAELGITDIDYGKALLTFDYDNDGDLDLFITNSQSTPVLYRNNLNNQNTWVILNLFGRRSNAHGLQAKVYLKKSETGPVRYHELIGGNNFLSQNEMIIHFGLGDLGGDVFSIEIRWPSGETQVLRSVPPNQELVVFEPGDHAYWLDQFFNKNEQSDILVSGDDADPDKDGLINLLEEAFATSPRKPDYWRPRFQIETPGVNKNSIHFTYERNASRPDLIFGYEVSSGFLNWSPVSQDQVFEQVVSYNGNGREKVSVSLPAFEGNRQFVRLTIGRK
ncbi:MAG: VCBS repeat-containing protein [Verrucomicrobiae bacterium]|nr:VCBS repeat-containing protein [Verrucomicrobiae bacterium]